MSELKEKLSKDGLILLGLFLTEMILMEVYKYFTQTKWFLYIFSLLFALFCVYVVVKYLIWGVKRLSGK